MELQALGISPFLLLFRRLPLSPSDISIPELLYAPGTIQNHFLEILAKQEVAPIYVDQQLATYKKKMKEYFDKKSLLIGKCQRIRYLCSSPNSRLLNLKIKKLQARYHGGRTLKKSINFYRIKVGYVRAEVNNWDSLDVDSDEEALGENEVPSSSFGPPGVDAPKESGWDTQLNSNPNNQIPQHKEDETHTVKVQE